LLVSAIRFLQEIPEKEELQDYENYKKLDDDDYPDPFPPPRHGSESIKIKTEQSVNC
jgi:hypothetical protein